MADIDYTMSILHRYLKELSIKVSYGRIRKLLATPMGCSVRGISDALDSLHITHEVYQLPATYLSKIEAPFLALMHNGRYCLVKSIQEEKTILLSDKGKEENLPTKQFIAAWKGVVLIIDETQTSYHEPYYQLKQILYLAKKYRCLSTIGLAGIIYLLASPRQTGDLLFNTLTWIGLAVSILIIYKESYNKDFLQRFCKIGNIVDCNEILHSKAASINGIITLGEMALLYYSTLFLSTAFHIPLYYSIWTRATCNSIAFTLWSVGYQVIIARKLCMFCLSIDIIIWLQALVLFSTDMAAWHLNISSIFAFILIGTLCCTAWYALKELLDSVREVAKLKDKRVLLLSYPTLFDTLLQMGHAVPNAEKDMTIQREAQGGKLIQIIINPHCKHCANEHQEWMKPENASIRILFSIAPQDTVGKDIALAIITCYLEHGFQKAMHLLNEWFEKQNSKFIAYYKPIRQAEQMLEAQQAYCQQIHLKHTPFITVNEREMPQVYDIEDVQYV